MNKKTISDRFNKTIDFPIEADLSFYSFAAALSILSCYNSEAFKNDLRGFTESLKIHIDNYHEAHKLYVASGINVEIDPTLKEDEWMISKTWVKDNEFYTLNIFSPGA